MPKAYIYLPHFGDGQPEVYYYFEECAHLWRCKRFCLAEARAYTTIKEVRQKVETQFT
jgi:hypothetical protein